MAKNMATRPLERGIQIDYHIIMSRRRFGTFSGGIDLPQDKEATIDKAIQPIDEMVPVRRLCIPQLTRCKWEVSSALKPGMPVSKGAELATCNEKSIKLTCPTDATFCGLGEAQIPTAWQFVPCVTLKLDLDGKNTINGLQPDATTINWRSLSEDQLRERLKESSILTHRRPSEPLWRWAERARFRKCKTLVVNVMEQQPYITADHRVLAEYGQEITAAVSMLKKIIQADSAMLVADHRLVHNYREVSSATQREDVELIALEHKYPMGADNILATILAGREVPIGRTPMSIGIAIIDAATCLALYRWIQCEHKLAGRVVTLAGPMAEKPGNYFVPFGTPVNTLTGKTDALVIHNGPMTGIPCPKDAVVTEATNAILMLKKTQADPPRQCIRCGWCTDHCPARINVAAINDDYELGLLDQAKNRGVKACVGCGVCSYVCPAKLPLTKRMNQLRWTVTRKDRNLTQSTQ